MNPDRRTALAFPAARLVAFGALAALAAAQWMRLVEEPPAGRVALAVVLLLAGAALLALIAARHPRRAVAWALAAVALVVATAAGFAAIGVPVRLLEPGGSGELGSEIGRGFTGLTGDVAYPYRGANEWSRLVILAGLPLALGTAAALAFWPRRSERARRTAPLVVLAATFAVGATVVAPERPLVWGFLLLICVAAWLWLPSLSARDALAGGAIVAAAGLFALPLAAVLDHERPWIDFREWELGRTDPATYEWDHSYGPIDWPRDGTPLAAFQADHAQYWKTAVLDHFDGTTWLRPEQTIAERMELPTQVERGVPGATLRQPHPEWIEEVQVTLGPIRSEFVLGSGAVITVDGLDSVLSTPDGSLVTGDEPLEEGERYTVIAYVPDPTARQMRRAPDQYAPGLSRYTSFTLPGAPERSGSGATQPAPFTEVDVPLRGSGAAGERAARREIAASPYAGVQRLAERLTRGAATTYDAVRAIESELQTRAAYSESPPKHRYPLRSFLFDERIGYCQQFSGAMALMLRTLGIPARVATGFSPGTPAAEDKHRFIAEDLDAHSWVEVYFPRIGWVTFDPTPAAAPSSGQPGDSGATVFAGRDLDFNAQNAGIRRKEFNPTKAQQTADSAGGPAIPLWTVPAAVGLLALAGLVAVAATAALRRYRYSNLTPAARAEAHLRELPPALARLGWPVKPAETLLALEHRLYTYRKDAAANYIRKLRTTRFTPTPDGAPALTDRRALRTELTAAHGLRARLRGLLALPPGGPTS